MPQSRITLSPNIQALANDLCQVTGCSNFASLFGLMLTRYGAHLRLTWQVTFFEQPKKLEQFSIPTVEPPEEPTQSSHFVEEDPVISRLASLVENF